MWNHTVGILIGGMSRRMGTPKHLIELPTGGTMFDAMVSFASQTAENTVIIGGDIQGYDSVHDLRAKQGPVAGIEALLKSGFDDRYLVVGCDMPQLVPSDVSPLLEAEHAAAFKHDEQIICLPLMISDWVTDACTAYLDAGHRSIRGFLSSIEYTSISVDRNMATALASINTREDLDNLTLE